MGNLCGKESSPDNFSQPGRTVDSVPPPANQTVRVPPKVGGPPRTLGGSGAGPAQQEDARKKAAAAAEARAQAANKPKGKLGSQLDEQKRQTRIATLDAASKEERRMRDSDAAQESRAYN